jgi:YD repeat-containing protein
MPYLYLIRLALRPLVTLLGLFVSLSVQLWAQTPAPTASQNYVLEQMPRDGLPSLTAVSGYQALQTRVSYFDGLGRPVQSVQWRGSGTGTQDIITNATTYDPFGRPNRTLIPTALGSASGYTSQTTIQNTAATFYGDTAPFSETRYEASPLNRTTQQFGPGQFWQTNNRPVNTAYSTANTSVFRYIVQADGSMNAFPGVSNPYYPANDLTVKTITDEQGNLTKEFSDLQGRVIRRDVIVSASEVLSTQYVYDDLGRLTAVIPPKHPSTSNIPITNNPVFDELVFYYQYDGRGRIIRKHIPGAGWTELVYDTSDRLVMTQDEQDRAEVKWRFTKYDGLNRPIRTGRKLSGLSRAFLQSEFDALTRETFPATFVIAETDLLSENRYDAYPSALTIDN